MRILLIGMSLALAAVSVRPAFAQASERRIDVIPQPVTVTPRTGRFTVTPRTVIWTDAAAASIGHQFANYLEPATGFVLRVRAGGAPPAAAIAFRVDRTLKRLGPEGYLLDVRPTRVVVRAPERA